RRAASAFDHQDRLIGRRGSRSRPKTTPRAAVRQINPYRAGFGVTRPKKHDRINLAMQSVPPWK
ncbi:hypothetical protein ACVGWD_00300, partial [Enterobacter asburiae]